MIAKTRRVTGCLHTEITTDDTGPPILTWHFDQDARSGPKRPSTAGMRCCPPSPPSRPDAAEILRRRKGRGTVERRYSDFKGLAVIRLFVRDNKRIAVLITVIYLALLVFCLIEHQVRMPLRGVQKMRGLYPGDQAVRLTGRMILNHLSDLRLRVGNATDPPTIGVSRGIQLHHLDPPGLEPTHPRRPETLMDYPRRTLGAE